MHSGTRPTKPSHLDFDYIGNRPKFGALGMPQFPEFYNADRINWRPNQSIAETDPIAHTAQPMGCTNFSTAYCANNLIGSLKFTPDELEAVSHANAQGGADVRTQLDTARKLGWFPAYYNVRGNTLYGHPIDHFDALRLALMEGITEHRVVSTGTPWYYEFETIDANGILPMPKDINNPISWHNHDWLGFITISGIPYLMNESHQGDKYGDKGLVYWSRELTNAVMSVYGSVAFIPANPVDSPALISLPWWQYVQSLARSFYKSWLPYSYGASVMLWDTPAHIRRNVRVMCDEAGLSWATKNVICSIIRQESNWDPKAINTKNVNGTTDMGLLQINNHVGYWIGAGLYFASTDEVLNNPQKSVEFIIMQAKAGNLKFWSSYKFNQYQKWLLVESLPSVAY